MTCGTVTAEVSYLKKLPLYKQEKPFQLYIHVDGDCEETTSSNLEFESRAQTFVDIRDKVENFSLDSHGFQILRCDTTVGPASFVDRDAIESRYLPEIEQVLKNISDGYDKILLFDWRVRSAATPKEDEVEFDMNDFTQWLRPSTNVHVDQTPRAVVHRVLLHLGDEAPFLLRGRVRIINAWRPIEYPVEDYPLAFCDASSVPEEDLVECDHVRRKFKGANFYTYFNAEHKWYYLGGQRPDEVALLKMFDSDSGMRATRCPHASFHHPMSGPGAKPRKSIEVRALIFNYPSDDA